MLNKNDEDDDYERIFDMIYYVEGLENDNDNENENDFIDDNDDDEEEEFDEKVGVIGKNWLLEGSKGGRSNWFWGKESVGVWNFFL